jgi:flavin-dependent dehydrogenase
MSARHVAIVGGGAAGLAAAIEAAQRGDAVTVCESGALGRDKVCGEFLSPETMTDFVALGCERDIEALQPVAMRTVLVTTARGGALRFTLEGAPALALTRRAMETVLAARARQLGVEVLERCPVTSTEPSRGGWRWCSPRREGSADVLVAAFGKRSHLDADFDLPRAREPEESVAVKAYFDAPSGLESDVELHLVRGGYVGLNPVEGGRLGLCALLDGEPTTDWGRLSDRFASNAVLRERLDRLGHPKGPIRGLARFGFGPQRIVARRDESIALLCGDAARLMPSFSGDGIAVALRSGRLAAVALSDGDPARRYLRNYRAEFSRRFRFATLLHRAFFRPALAELLMPLLSHQPRVTQRLCAWTRGAA